MWFISPLFHSVYVFRTQPRGLVLTRCVSTNNWQITVLLSTSLYNNVFFFLPSKNKILKTKEREQQCK